MPMYGYKVIDSIINEGRESEEQHGLINLIINKKLNKNKTAIAQHAYTSASASGLCVRVCVCAYAHV